MRLSQGHLNTLSQCPRKFQHVYLEQLGSPTTPEQQERLAWGSQFHLLMQQYELGLPVVEFERNDGTRDPLQNHVTALVEAAPDLFQSTSARFRQSEHRRTLQFQGYLLTVIYDLLILDDQQAHILDWKTYPRPQRHQWLRQNWQTRLYPFVLAATSDYQPEQIAMTYWFVQGSASEVESPQHLRFEYSSAQYECDRQDLSNLLAQLTTWLKQYEAGEPFPQVGCGAACCDSCSFARRCQRGQSELPVNSTEPIPDLTQIQEVAL